MSWRGMDPGIKAAGRGYWAVMAPVGIAYFDWYQTKDTSQEPLAWGGYTPLQTVYHFTPLSPNAQLAPSHHHYILGGQGQLWTEYMPNSSHVEYMAFPRLSALAEALWFQPLSSPPPLRTESSSSSSPQESNDKNKGQDWYSDFFQRLVQGHLPRLDALQVNYRTPKDLYE